MSNKKKNFSGLRKLNVQQVQPKGGINLYQTTSSSKSASLPEGANFFDKFFNEGSFKEPSLAKRINTIYQFTILMQMNFLR